MQDFPYCKLEIFIPESHLDETVEAVIRIHPYEEPVINVIPLCRTSLP